MNEKLFIIRKEPKFIISILKETLEIQKDDNSLNDKSYNYEDLKAISIENENKTFIHILLWLISPGAKKNEKTLIVQTENSIDKLYLKDCDLEELERFIKVITKKIL